MRRVESFREFMILVRQNVFVRIRLSDVYLREMLKLGVNEKTNPGINNHYYAYCTNRSDLVKDVRTLSLNGDWVEGQIFDTNEEHVYVQILLANWHEFDVWVMGSLNIQSAPKIIRGFES